MFNFKKKTSEAEKLALKKILDLEKEITDLKYSLRCKQEEVARIKEKKERLLALSEYNSDYQTVEGMERKASELKETEYKLLKKDAELEGRINNYKWKMDQQELTINTLQNVINSVCKSCK